MNIVKVGNKFYFLYIALAVVWLIFLVLVLRKRKKKTAHIVFIVILFCNLALHFIKQAFPPYINDPHGIVRSGLQNICAVSTVLLPFLYLFKRRRIVHSFCFFIGVVGGGMALFYPTEAIGVAAFCFDTVRFYICHTILFSVPIAAAVLNIYRPRLRDFWVIPVMFLVWETIICLYEFFIAGVGLIDQKIPDLFNPGLRNSSFTFGVRPDFAWASKLLDPLVPKIFRTDFFNVRGGQPFYFPVLWLAVPSVVLCVPVYILISSPFWILECVKKSRARR